MKKKLRPIQLAALLATACAGEVANLGDGPLDSPVSGVSPASISCESGIGCEGGECETCLLETCFCDGSAQVSVGGCVASGATATEPVVSDDGNTLAFAVCLEDGRCRSYYWTAATGSQQIPTVGLGHIPTGISGDGQLVLLSPVLPSELLGPSANAQGELVPPPAQDPADFSTAVYRVGGAVTETGLPSWIPGDFTSPQQIARLSANGSVVGLTWAEGGVQQLARWSEARGLELLATFPVQGSPSPYNPYGWDSRVTINGVTPDASAVVGVHGNGQPLLWTATGGVQSELGPVPEFATLMAISRDGSAVVGGMFMGETVPPSAFHWRRDQDSVTNLGVLDLGGSSYFPTGVPSLFVSDDGSAVGGLLTRGREGNYPFHWTEASGVSEPLTLYAGISFTPPSVSGEGRVIGDGPNRQFYYSYSHPYRDRPEPPHRFRGGPVSGLSHDGRVTVGIGQCGGVDAVYRELVAWEE